MKKPLYDLAQIATTLDVSRQAIDKRAKKEAWPVAETIVVRGQEKRLFDLTKLPKDIATAFALLSLNGENEHDGSGKGRVLRLGAGYGVPANVLSNDQVIKSNNGTRERGPRNGNDSGVSARKGKNPADASAVLYDNGRNKPIGTKQAVGGDGNYRDLRQRGGLGLQSNHQGGDARGMVDSITGGLGVQSPNTGVTQSSWQSSLLTIEAAPNYDKDQLTTHQARANIVNYVTGFPGSVDAAIAALNLKIQQGDLTDNHLWSVKNCIEKPRGNTLLAPSTYKKWLKRFKDTGYFAPLKRKPDMTIKPWHGPAIALMQRPQGTTKQYIFETLQPQFPYLSYHMVDRYFRDKFSKSDVIKGRHTGSALKAKQKYYTRDTSSIEPWGELHMDGWNTHFTAPHPIGGQYVTYEIWHAHDLATKYTPPVSIGLTENFEVIAACIENAIRFGGVPRIIQTDSTKIIKNSARMKTDPHTALSERFGFTFVHPKQVGNSQANGTPENFNTSLDRASRELATYQGKGMDSLTLKRVKKITEKMVKAKQTEDEEHYLTLKNEAEKQGKGIVFTSRNEAVAWINEQIEKANNRPHRSLPKMRDAETGKQRHQTPKEALQQWINDGWQPLMVDEAVLITAFRPHTKVKVTREMVIPYGGMRYSHADLSHFNGKEVVVVYDTMNYEQVMIKDLDGSFICTADFMYSIKRAKTFQESTEEKRALAQIKLREGHIAQIRRNTPSLESDVVEGEVLQAFAFPVKEKAPELVRPDWTSNKKKEDEITMPYNEVAQWLYGEKQDKELPKNELAAG